MNGTNELLRAILKMDEEERLRTQATEEYRRKAQTDRSQAARQQEEAIMAQMRTQVDQFAASERERASQQLEQLEQRKQQVLAEMEACRDQNLDTWVKTITSRVLDREA